MHSVAEVVGLALDRAQLQRELGPFCLLGRPPRQYPEGEGWSFRTHSLDARIVQIGRSQVIVHADDVIAPCKKRPGASSFAGVILIGRSASNDVELEHPSVSKLHARLELGADDASLSDAGSSNGTFVDEKRLVPGEQHRVSSGSLLGFGNCSFLLLSHEALLSVLAQPMRPLTGS